MRDAAIAAGVSSRLAAAHGAAIDELAAMRAAHLGMASRYLRKALKGTGGSDFRTMHHEGLHSTRASSTT